MIVITVAALVIAAVIGICGRGGAAGARAVPHIGRETVVYMFRGAPSDGAQPYAGLIAGHGGALYGTTAYGGASNAGTVFRLVPAGSSYAEALLHTFSGPDGQEPEAPLIADATGALYGTTTIGGASGVGTVFELTPTASGFVESVLHSFVADSADGANPRGGLVRDSAGVLYGTTPYGGTHRAGTVFALYPEGGRYTERVLYAFGRGPYDGNDPFGGLAIDASGTLYGAAAYGGRHNLENGSGFGTVFALTPSGNRRYREKTLYRFDGAHGDGNTPVSGVVLDGSGALYGTTFSGGAGGSGIVYKLTPSAHGYVETIVLNLEDVQGGQAEGDLAIDARGALFGTTFYHGAIGGGIVFSLTPTPSGYTPRLLDNFPSASEGEGPTGRLLLDGHTVFGTTRSGGTHGAGLVFALTRSERT